MSSRLTPEQLERVRTLASSSHAKFAGVSAEDAHALLAHIAYLEAAIDGWYVLWGQLRERMAIMQAGLESIATFASQYGPSDEARIAKNTLAAVNETERSTP